jgi:hypothetical protein
MAQERPNATELSQPASCYPPLPSRLGKRGTARKPSGAEFHWQVIGEVRRVQSNLPSCILCLERILFEENQRIEVRIGYYIIGEKPKDKGQMGLGAIRRDDANRRFQVSLRSGAGARLVR